jgi:membrane protein required for colicin V production
MDWNQFDAIIVGIIVVIGIKGFFNGFIHELSGLIGAALGIAAGSALAEKAGAVLGQWIPLDSPSALALIGFLAVALGVWLAFVIVGVLIDKRFVAGRWGWPGRFAGFLCASAKVFLILSVIVTALYHIEFVRKNAQPYIDGSRLFPYLERSGKLLMRYEPIASAHSHFEEKAVSSIEKHFKEKSGQGAHRP